MTDKKRQLKNGSGVEQNRRFTAGVTEHETRFKNVNNQLSMLQTGHVTPTLIVLIAIT